MRSQDPDFATKVIWSDEKLWQDRRVPNKQNERVWAASDPFVEVDCRTQSVSKRMCWAGICDGRVLLYWFDANERLNQDSYLDLLRQFFWPKVQRKVRSKELWFQQDGATAHTVQGVRDWLTDKFQERVISNKMDIKWPPKSPDMSPLDYWLWGACDQHIKESKPNSIEELMEHVSDYVKSIPREVVYKAVKDIYKRAGCCLENGGGAFESKLKMYKKNN